MAFCPRISNHGKSLTVGSVSTSDSFPSIQLRLPMSRRGYTLAFVVVFCSCLPWRVRWRQVPDPAIQADFVAKGREPRGVR